MIAIFTAFKRCSVLFFFSALLWGQSAQADQEGSLAVTIQNITSKSGMIKLSLFPDKNGFPYRSENASNISVKPPPRVNAMTVYYTNVPPGDYALYVCHDLNLNDQCESAFFSSEPQTFSGQEGSRFLGAAPSFDEAVFEIGRERKDLTVTLP